ncbi:tautomerase family protein [Umezawaea tangerina]|uniref:Phenylpyruvate tautomerase PptA (4-oxalocrotonate tautomerase family) n=1 Tax=Umezawaea tangerina TaxID=84725 RepID=A0A2T0T7V6_9PSEU|nr:tautomerase family protein [Umezawaea tangerina]PRY41743.1 phenylpyruvate tautomerase PptA (4-oxalocrotonate tautomerase family) [Umezawaea tangerina]
MPRLDAYIPEGALTAEAEDELLSTLTDILLRNEGADPRDPTARSIAFVWLHRPAKVFRAGAAHEAPIYRFEPRVPEGQYDEERRRAMVEEITAAVLDAERGAYDRDALRIWVFPTEVPEGSWGAAGRVWRLADIAGLIFGDREKGRAFAEKRLGVRRSSVG